MVRFACKSRWFRPTPGSLAVLSLTATGLLFLSERFDWFAFNRHKGWTVLIAVAAIGVELFLLLLWFIAAIAFRRRFQFSIRALLVLTIAVALPTSWLATELKKARDQNEVAEAIRR